MKIAYMMRYWPVYGGGETITVTLANELVKRGHEVHILYNYFKNCTPMPYEIDPRIKQEQIFTVENYTQDNVNQLHDYLKNHEIDIMINQWASTELCNLARKSLSTKLITCWHLDVLRNEKPVGVIWQLFHKLFGDKIFQKVRRYLQIRGHKRNYSLSDKYVFLSRSFEKIFLEQSKIKDTKYKLESIPNPLTYNFFYDVDRLNVKKKKLLFVGRIFEYHKRLSYILNIWKKVAEDNRFDDWSLVIVGDGPDMVKTKALANEMALPRVSFEGFKKPDPYYDESKIFLMTSAFEGFGMTLVEAQQYGVVPIVMDTYGSLHDIISSENNGIIVADNDINGFVEQLKRLMLNEILWNKLSISGLQSCSKFHVTTIVDQWENLFRNFKSCDFS